MRILAGVLIIIVALLDLLGSLGYLGVGAFAAGAGEMAKAAGQQSDDPDAKMKAETTGAEAKATGTVLLAFGVLLLALGGMGIAAGVILFLAKAPGFVILVGLLQIGAEGFSFYLHKSAGITNYLAIGTGVLMILAAMSYKGKPAAAPTAGAAA